MLGSRVRIVALASLVVTLVAAAPASAPALEGTYTSVATRIAVRLTQRLSSQDARTGDPFAFDTSSSVVVDGVFLAAGTHGRGVVVLARSARGPQPGALALEAQSLDLPSGRPLPVGLEAGQLDRKIERDGRGATVPIGGATVYLGSDRSTNVVYEKGTDFIVVAPPPETPGPRGSAG